MDINQVKFAKVVEVAKAKAAGHARWIAAIEKAVAGLAAGWIVTELADGIMVTTESGLTYHANGACQCEAFRRNQPCKHRALARLIELYKAEPETARGGGDGHGRYCGDRDLQHLDACAPHIERSVEREFNVKTGRTGKRLQVVRIGGWTI